VLSPDDGCGEPVVLLVPDGNWSQARRIVHRDPDARDAEAVRLPPGAPSRYRLRRSPREGTVSTLEAVARALAVLEGEAIERGLARLLEVFVARTERDAGRVRPGCGATPPWDTT
jgi:DTW domain-containing protein YfiP